MKLPLTLTIRPTHALLNSNSRLSPHSIPADISHFVRAYPFDQNDETVKKKERKRGGEILIPDVQQSGSSRDLYQN